jgi:hypothetical protein
MDRVAFKKKLIMTPTSDLVNNALFKYQLFVFGRPCGTKQSTSKTLSCQYKNSIQLTEIDVFFDAKAFQETTEGRG